MSLHTQLFGESYWRALGVGAVIFWLLVKVIQWRAQMAKLSKIPTVGHSGFLSSYVGAFKYIRDARGIIEEGYRRYHGSAFKVPLLDGWLVVVCGKSMVEDIRKASRDELCFNQASIETVQTELTIGPMHGDFYHIGTLRTALQRNLVPRYHEVQDEITVGFADEIPEADDWVKVPIFKTAQKLVCRATSRIFVGLPLCRNVDYVEFNIRFALDAMVSASIIKLFPDFLKPLVGRYLTRTSANIKRATRHLLPLIEERMAQLDEHGKQSANEDQPNDLISWLLNDAEGPSYRRDTKDIVIRVLGLNLAAIHTTSALFTDSVYYLAADTHLAERLRKEVEGVIREFGWSKASMDKLLMMDSFIKESGRHTGTGAVTMNRKVLKDFTFSDGTTVPAGTILSAAAYSLHHDQSLYDLPESYDPLRFYKLNEDERAKNQLVTPHLDYIFFGHGRHTCPGRFFASTELKTMLAHLLINYDVRFEDGKLPEHGWFSEFTFPSRTAEVMFRKRREASFV